MGSRIVLTQTAPCNDLMPEVLSYKHKKNNWPLPVHMFQRKRKLYGPKEVIRNECETLLKDRFMTNTKCKLFQKAENLKVMKCFQMFKESFIADLEKLFLNMFNVTPNRIRDMLVNTQVVTCPMFIFYNLYPMICCVIPLAKCLISE